WDITRFDDDTRPAGTLVKELDALLRVRVADRLESEVPLGAFLSGGLDSGLIVSYMADACDRPVRTTSVGFDASDHNELAAARARCSACPPPMVKPRRRRSSPTRIAAARRRTRCSARNMPT